MTTPAPLVPAGPAGPRTRVTAVLVLIALLAAAGILVRAGLGWDFANFYDTGRRALAGQINDIYHPDRLIHGVPPQGNMAFWGAPISAWLYAPIALLPPPAALIAFKLIGTLATVAGLVVLYRMVVRVTGLEGKARGDYAFCFSLLILLYQPFWTIYRVGGQTTPLVFLLVVLALVHYLEGRYALTAAWLVGAVLFKPAFVLVPIFLVLVSPPALLGWLAVIGGATALASVALFGWPVHAEFLDILRRGADKPSPWPFNSGLYILADAFRPIADSIPVRRAGGWVPDAIRLALKLLVLAVTVGLLLKARHRSWHPLARRLFHLLLAISFTLLISQVVWEHYLALLFIPLALLFAAWPRFTRLERGHLLAIVALCTLQNLVLVSFFRELVPIRSTLGLLGVSLVKAGPLLAWLGFLWFYRERLFTLVGLLPAGLAAAGVPQPVPARDEVVRGRT